MKVNALTQRHFLIPFYGLIITIASACSDGSKHVVISLPKEHLSSTPAGLWLLSFDLDYSQGAKRLKLQVRDNLEKNGTLVDKFIYQSGANKVGAKIWEYKGNKFREEHYSGGIWEGPNVVSFQKYYNGGPAENLWITVEFSEGVPYSELLPKHYMQLEQNRKHEHSATVESELDQGRRLFLFGYGAMCKRISLFEV